VGHPGSNWALVDHNFHHEATALLLMRDMTANNPTSKNDAYPHFLLFLDWLLAQFFGAHIFLRMFSLS